MNLIVIFESAELQFKQILEEFFVSIYDEKSLVSHGIDHHQRVWKYAKEITLFLASHDLIRDPVLPFNLIIACYLHDIGMSVDTGVRHGHQSRELCVRFLKENNLKESDYDDVLQAIENHDNKEYRDSAAKFDLLTILSTADDIDAFGFIGIYRYVEIYLARDIGMEKIGHRVMENAAKRFDNFENLLGFSDSIFQKHKNRYNILINFFGKYNHQAPSYKFGGPEPSGYCGAIEILKEFLQKRITLDFLLREPEKYSNDKVIKWFFNGLASELLVEDNPLTATQ
jgi:HD superfamily phosphodiesterase